MGPEVGESVNFEGRTGWRSERVTATKGKLRNENHGNMNYPPVVCQAPFWYCIAYLEHRIHSWFFLPKLCRYARVSDLVF